MPRRVTTEVGRDSSGSGRRRLPARKFHVEQRPLGARGGGTRQRQRGRAARSHPPRIMPPTVCAFASEPAPGSRWSRPHHRLEVGVERWLGSHGRRRLYPAIWVRPVNRAGRPLVGTGPAHRCSARGQSAFVVARQTMDSTALRLGRQVSAPMIHVKQSYRLAPRNPGKAWVG